MSLCNKHNVSNLILRSSYYHAVLKTQRSQAILDFCVTKTRLGKSWSHDLSRRHHFRKAPLSKFFPFTPKQKACVFKFLRFESVIFEKLRFRDKICCVRSARWPYKWSLEGPSILRARSTRLTIWKWQQPDNEYNKYKYVKVC